MDDKTNNADARLIGEMMGLFPEGGIDDRKELIRDLTLALMFLTSWEEKSASGSAHRCWKGFDWDAVDELRDMGLVEGSNKAKSLYLTDEGMGLGCMLAGVCREAMHVGEAHCEYTSGEQRTCFSAPC